MVESRPLGPSDYSDLGNRFLAAHQYERAGAAFYECLKRAPANVGAALGLATASRELGKLEIAVKVLETALGFSPRDIRLLVTLGAALQEHGDAERAVEILRQARAVEPGNVEALFNLGNALQEAGHAAEAEAAYRDALALRPGDGDARTNLIRTLMKRGKVVEMAHELRIALEAEPANLLYIRLLLFVLVYLPGCSPAEILSMTRQAIGRLDTVEPSPAWQHRATGHPLRIGFLSGDLRNHPVGRNLIPLVERLDPTRFSLVFFSDTPAADGMTARFRARAAAWHDTSGLADADVSERVRGENIDVLVIVAARFDDNRMLFGLQRAAPVQVSLYDAATSAQPNLDYFIGDRFIVPRHIQPFFSERVIRLPSFYIHDPIPNAPDVGALPFATTGEITLGCLNNPFKLNEQVLSLWARLLKEIPNARLLLSYKSTYASADLRERTLRPFADAGIELGRIVLSTEQRAAADYLNLYNVIDLALDPFPFSGSTTTFEALWMGVPTVTWAGDTFMSRWTGAMLHALKLDEFITDGAEAYIAAVRRWSERPVELAALRASLRDRVKASPLCNADRRARQMERLLSAVSRTVTSA